MDAQGGRRGGWLVRHAAGGIAALVAAGCQSAGPGADEGADGRTLPAMADLQGQRPDGRAMRLPPPPGVDPAAVEPLSSEALVSSEPAGMGIEAVVELLASTGSAGSDAGSAAAPADPKTLALYAAGRSAMLEGRGGEAITALEAASRRSPGDAAVWRELGEAQLAAGKRSAALGSFRRSAAAGPGSPRVLSVLAAEAARAGRSEEAAGLLARALSWNETIESGLATVIDLTLGEAVGRLGYVRASRDLLARGLERPLSSVAQSRYRAEVGELMRRRGELWRRAGDLSCRLGEYEAALDAYTRSADGPMLDPAAATPRRMHALLRLGNPAGAALAVVEDLKAGGTRVERRHLESIRFLAASTGEGPRLAASLQEMAAAAGTTLTPTSRTTLTRAAAAALPEGEARALLLRHLTAGPADPDALGQLLGTFAPEEVSARAGMLVGLVEARPDHAGIAAAVVLQRGVGVDATTDLLAADERPAARLIASSLLLRLGRADLAAARMRSAPWSAPFLAAALEARAAAALVLSDRAELDAVQRELESLGEGGERVLSEVLESRQRPEEARRLLDSVMARSSSPDMTDLLRSARLAARAGDAAGSEAALRRAVDLDPIDERAYEALLGVYSATSPLASEEKLTATARSLRQQIPSSRVMRGLAAQDLLARSLWSEAEALLLPSIEGDQENPAFLNLLVTAWERGAATDPAATDRAEVWLRGRLAERPESAALLMSLARILLVTERAGEAETILATRLARWPIPDLARLRERVIREGLRDPARADSLAAQRLAAAPRTFDSAMELAELLAAGDRAAEGLGAVADAVEVAPELTPPQAARLLALLGRTRPEVIDGPGDPTPLLRFLGVGSTVLRPPSDAFLQQWLRVAVLRGDIDDARHFCETLEDPERVARIVIANQGSKPDLASESPRRAEVAYTLASLLTALGRPGVAVEVYRLALEYRPDHPWVENDLGYLLLESGGDFAEAERLIESAYEALPDQASVIDSVAWVRYKRGVLLDVTDAAGGVVRRGAEGLLREAVATEGGANNPTMLDHYADTLWRVGKTAEARRLWSRAEMVLRAMVAQATEGEPTPTKARWERELASIEGKLEASMAGEEPRLEPLLDEAE